MRPSARSIAPVRAQSAGDHVFASVQSLTAYDVTTLPRRAFDIVVVDEFHHAAAPTYRKLLDSPSASANCWA